MKTKNTFNNKFAKGLISLVTIIILLSSILATSIYYENNITANVISEISTEAKSTGILITEVNDIKDLSQLNEGWYKIRNGFVYYLDTFNSNVPLYIRVLNAEQQNGLLVVDEDGNVKFDNYSSTNEKVIVDENVESGEGSSEFEETKITGAIVPKKEEKQVRLLYMKPTPKNYESFLDEATRKYGKGDPDFKNLLKAIATAESGWNPTAKSPKNAMGIMQVLPSTARGYKVDGEYVGIGDLFDSRKNILVGAQHFRYLLDKYNGNVHLALSAYNAGSGNVKGEIPLIPETQGYVMKVITAYEIEKKNIDLPQDGVTITIVGPPEIKISDFGEPGKIKVESVRVPQKYTSIGEALKSIFLDIIGKPPGKVEPSPVAYYQDGDKVKTLEGIVFTRVKGVWVSTESTAAFNDEQIKRELKAGTTLFKESISVQVRELEKDKRYVIDYVNDHPTATFFDIVSDTLGSTDQKDINKYFKIKIDGKDAVVGTDENGRNQIFYTADVISALDPITKEKVFAAKPGKEGLSPTQLKGTIEFIEIPQPKEIPTPVKRPIVRVPPKPPAVIYDFQYGDQVEIGGIIYTREFNAERGEAFWRPDEKSKDRLAKRDAEVSEAINKGSKRIPRETLEERIRKYSIEELEYILEIAKGEPFFDPTIYEKVLKEKKEKIKEEKPSPEPVIKIKGEEFEVVEIEGNSYYITSDGYSYRARDNKDGTYTVDIFGQDYKIYKEGGIELVEKVPTPAPPPTPVEQELQEHIEALKRYDESLAKAYEEAESVAERARIQKLQEEQRQAYIQAIKRYDESLAQAYEEVKTQEELRQAELDKARILQEHIDAFKRFDLSLIEAYEAAQTQIEKERLQRLQEQERQEYIKAIQKYDESLSEAYKLAKEKVPPTPPLVAEPPRPAPPVPEIKPQRYLPVTEITVGKIIAGQEVKDIKRETDPKTKETTTFIILKDGTKIPVKEGELIDTKTGTTTSRMGVKEVSRIGKEPTLPTREERPIFEAPNKEGFAVSIYAPNKEGIQRIEIEGQQPIFVHKDILGRITKDNWDGTVERTPEGIKFMISEKNKDRLVTIKPDGTQLSNEKIYDPKTQKLLSDITTEKLAERGKLTGDTKTTTTLNPGTDKFQITETTTLADGSKIEIKYKPASDVIDDATVTVTAEGKTSQFSGKIYDEIHKQNIGITFDRINQLIAEATRTGIKIDKVGTGTIGDTNSVHLRFDSASILTMNKEFVIREITKDGTTTDFEGNVKRDEFGKPKLEEGSLSRTFNNKGELTKFEFVKNNEHFVVIYEKDRIIIPGSEKYDPDDPNNIVIDKKFGFDPTDPNYGKLKIISGISDCPSDGCIFDVGIFGSELYYIDEKGKKQTVDAGPILRELIEKSGDQLRVYGARGKERGPTTLQIKSQRFFAEVERVLTEFQGLGYYATLFFDEDSLLEWRDKVDRAFATLYLGTEYWSSAICGNYLDGEDEGIAYAETPQGLAQVGAHIEATRTEAIETPAGREFIYKITFNVRNGDFEKDPRAPEEMNINVILKGERTATVFKQEQKVKRGSSFGRTGRNAIVQDSKAFFNEVCLTFDKVPFRWKVSNNEICNVIVESSGAATSVSTTATTTAGGGGGAVEGDVNDF